MTCEDIKDMDVEQTLATLSTVALFIFILQALKELARHIIEQR